LKEREDIDLLEWKDDIGIWVVNDRL